jgi:hypothetical protein
MKYEKPEFFDLTGNAAGIALGQLDFLNCTGGKGAARACRNGSSASGSCGNGNGAVADCYKRSSAKSLYPLHIGPRSHTVLLHRHECPT